MLLIDTCNLYYCTRMAYANNQRIDYQKYIRSAESMYGKQEVIAYVSLPDPKATTFVTYLESIGVTVRAKEPRIVRVGPTETMGANFNVEITVDALRFRQYSEPMIIGSNDVSLLPLLERLSTQIRNLYVYAVGPPKAFQQYAVTKEVGLKVLRQKHEHKVSN